MVKQKLILENSVLENKFGFVLGTLTMEAIYLVLMFDGEINCKRRHITGSLILEKK